MHRHYFGRFSVWIATNLRLPALGPFQLDRLPVMIDEVFESLLDLFFRVLFQARFFSGIMRGRIEVIDNLFALRIGDAIEQGVVPMVGEIADLLDR